MQSLYQKAYCKLLRNFVEHSLHCSLTLNGLCIGAFVRNLHVALQTTGFQVALQNVSVPGINTSIKRDRETERERESDLLLARQYKDMVERCRKQKRKLAEPVICWPTQQATTDWHLVVFASVSECLEGYRKNATVSEPQTKLYSSLV